MQSTYRLRRGTIVEPLIGKWWAWSHLISPAAASLQLANYQVPAMESYLVDPEAHVRACRDPELIGGAFVDVSPERASEIRHLLNETVRLRAAELQLAADLPRYSERLAQMATGQSLEPVYSQVPDSLKGCVELVYDYLHRSSCRIIEKLLYSRYHNPGLQTFRIFRKERGQARPFFMSSPRLIDSGDLEWKVPFADSRLDQLFLTDLKPAPLRHFRELLSLNDDDLGILLELLEDSDLPDSDPWSGGQIRVRHFGHACMLVEWNGTTILTDPVIETNPAANFNGLPQLPPHIDFALVTHNHQDHLSLETLLRLRGRIGTVVVPKSMGLLYGDLSLKAMLEVVGFKNVVEMDALDSIPIPEGEIIAVPFLGEHADLAHGKSGYVVRAGKHKMWFAADSDCLEPRTYQQLRKAIGRIETLFVGCESVGAPLSWSCGPFFPHKPTLEQENTRRYHGCNADAALALAEAVGAKSIFNYAMGLEPWMEFILGLCMTPASPQWHESEKLLTTARSRGFVAERPFGKWQKILNPQGTAVFAGFGPVPETQAPQPSPATPKLAIPPETVQQTESLAAELECAVSDIYVAGVCLLEMEDHATEMSLEIENREGRPVVISLDVSDNPTFRNLVDRVSLAASAEPKEMPSEAPRIAVSIEGLSPRCGEQASFASTRYMISTTQPWISMQPWPCSENDQQMVRLQELVAVLGWAVCHSDEHLSSLVSKKAPAPAAEAEFVF